ncbi:hypothetical protein ACFW04_001197 [Cataglyphis niger]
MPRFYVLLVNVIVVAMMIGITFSEGMNRESVQFEKPVRMTQMGNVPFSQNRKAMSLTDSLPIFFLHLLKYKVQYQKLDKIISTTTTSSTTTSPLPKDCICVPFYLCDSNRTIITDGTGIIDFRTYRCPEIYDVCCYLPNVTTSPPTMPPTAPPTVPSTSPPIIFPTVSPIPTVTVLPNCICVEVSLCDPNGIVTIFGEGIINPRQQYGLCSNVNQVCCRILASTTTSSPTTIMTTVLPNCICVEVSLCDPNGIVTIFGEGIINPRQQYGLCPNVNQVCCRILASTTQRVTTSPPTTMPMTTMTTMMPMTTPTTTPMTTPITTPMTTPMTTPITTAMTTPMTTPMTTTTTTPTPGQTQLCFVCNNTIQCFTCIIILAPNNSLIDPRFSQILSGGNVCALTTLLSCHASPPASSITDLLGPLKNPGTPQACYCVKTWLCSEGNIVSPDGLGIIDPRFTACSSADQVCCRLVGIDLQGLRSVSVSSSRDLVNRSAHSTSEITCGMQNNSYAPPEPAPTDSGKTYFAEFPWMVALLVKPTTGDSYVFQCGASMISNEAVLTAAHCVVNQKPENLIARFGQWNLGSNVQPLPIQEANILAIALHPSYYSGGLFHDVAVLVLEKPVVYSANVMPICLPEQGKIFSVGSQCYGIGWGSNSFGSEGQYQTELRKVDLPIVDHADCQTRLRSTKLGQYFQLHGSFICAGGETNRDTCRGDGGGPLICQAMTGQFFQAGIVSWGIGCGISNVPAVYASTSQHRQWIDQQLATFGV